MNTGNVARAAPCAAISAATTKRRIARGSRARSTRSRIDSDQRADAISADPAVAHDVELALARSAAAEAVGRVGEAVFVQAAGHASVAATLSAAARPGRQSELGRRTA